MSGLVRSACLTNYAETALGLKLDPFEQLRQVHLDPGCLRDPDLKIPTEAVARLLENSARTAGVEDFGLRMVETRKLTDLGPLAFLLRNELTVRRALEAFHLYLSLHNEGQVLQIEESHGVAVLRVTQVTTGNLPVRQIMDLSIAAAHRVLKTLLGSRWQPCAVCFSHAAPHDDSRYQRLFGASVQFNSPLEGIVFRSSDLDLTLPGADPVMVGYVHQYLNSIREESKTALLEKVRQVIWISLPTGRCSAEQVAADLGRCRRTLHRQLLCEGESFSALLDQVRAEVAVRYLDDSEYALSDIASLLGFSEPSAFTRWFKRCFGSNPSVWRACHLGQAPNR